MATYVGGGGGDAVAREGLEIPTHDYISNTYTGNNATLTVFKRGGADGVVVATLTRTFDGSNNLLTVTRT
jgi:hypothetical protein